MSLPIHEGALSYVEVWQIDMCDNRACGYFKQEKTG